MNSTDFPRLEMSRCELIARLLATFVVVIDARISTTWSNQVHGLIDPQTLTPTILLASLILSDGNAAAYGLVLRPQQGWTSWVLFALIAAGVILTLCLSGGFFYWMLGWSIPIPRFDPSDWAGRLYWMCVVAPIHEEIVYRILLTAAILPLLGTFGTMLAGGIIFGMIHVLGGNPGPDNLIAGFFLQWAYMRSGTVLVPIAMHASGNFIAFTAQLLVSSVWPNPL